MASTVCSTTLSFGLISVEVKLKKVQERKETSFELASPNGEKVRQVYVVEDTGEVVGTRADCVRGIFGGDGFHEIPSESLSAIDEETRLDAMVIERTLPLADVPWERVQGAYFIAPGGKGGPAMVKPLALMRDGFKATGKAGMGKLSIRTKTYPFVMYEKDGGLLVSTLVYADEFAQVAEAAHALEGVETDAKTLALAGTLIDQLAGARSDLDALADDRRERREELVAQALAGKVIEVTPKSEKPLAPVDDLADLLAASVAAAQKAA